MNIKTEVLKHEEGRPSWELTIHVGEHGRGHYIRNAEHCLNCNSELIMHIQKGLTLKTARDSAICPNCGCRLNGLDVIEKQKD